MNIKGGSGVTSDRNEHVGPWRKSYKVPELCSAFGFKVELVNNDTEYLAEVSKQNMEDVAWFLAAYSKMQGERKNLRKELVSKKEAKHDEFKNSHSIHTAKHC